VTILEDVVDNIPQWSQTPLSFFQEDGNALDLGLSPIGQLYKYVTEVTSRRIVDTIRTRFIKIAFHRLKERLGLHYMRSNNVDVVAQIISNSGMVNCGLDIIKRKISQWTDLGGRTEALCRSIGSSSTDEDSHLGNLLCLPEEYHDELYVIKPGRRPISLTTFKHKSFKIQRTRKRSRNPTD
jgi:hypothetical protein